MEGTGAIAHLLIITPGFPVDESDTSCLPAVQQFILAYRRIYPSTIITVLALHYPHRKNYHWNGCEVIALGNDNRGGLRKAFSLFTMSRSIQLLHDTRPVSAILCFWLSDTALAAKWLSKKLDVPYMVWMHGQDAKEGNKYVHKVKPEMKQLAAISAEQSKIFENAYGKMPAYIINNGVNPSLFPALNTVGRHIDLLAVGSLVPLKQYHLFVELVSRIKENGFPLVKAVLAGEGPQEEELKQQIVALHLEDNISCTGKLSHENVLQLMNNAKILVHPSAYEGHSTVILEALYSGCKVLSYRPVSDGAIDSFYLCADIAEMERMGTRLLKEALEHRRVMVNDMDTSVRQVAAILTSLQ